MLGHFAVDRIVVDESVETVSGGGVYYGAWLRGGWGPRSRLPAAREVDYDRAKRCVEGVTVYPAPAAETSGIANYYDSGDMERRTCVPIRFAKRSSPTCRSGAARGGGKRWMVQGYGRVYVIAPIMAGK